MKKSKQIMYILLFSLLAFWTISFVKFYSIKSEVGFIQRDGGVIYKDENRHQYFGMHEIDGKTYYFDPNTGYISEGFKKVGSKTFYFKKNGTVNTGLKKIKGDTYFFNKDGSIIKDELTFIDVDGKMQRSCFDENGKMLISKSTEIDGIQYSFDENGALYYDIKYLQKHVEEIAAKYKGTSSIYFKDLTTGETFSSNDRTYYACCMIKVPALVAVYQQIENGTIDFKSNQSDIEKMIFISDNTAFNHLMKKIGKDDGLKGLDLANTAARTYGMDSTVLHHGLKPGEDFFTDGESNISSAKDSGVLLENLYNGKVINEQRSKEMIELLKQCADTTKLVEGLPANTVIAHKSGDAELEAGNYNHDGGIIYLPNRNYILSVYTKDVTDPAAIMKEISQFVYKYQSIFAEKSPY